MMLATKLGSFYLLSDNHTFSSSKAIYFSWMMVVYCILRLHSQATKFTPTLPSIGTLRARITAESGIVTLFMICALWLSLQDIIA